MNRRALRIAAAGAASVAAIVFAVTRTQDTTFSSRPLIELAPARYDQSTVRDRDIDLYSRRVKEDPSSAIDRFTLAGLLFTRSRSTGSTSDLDRAEHLVRESISERTQRNYSAFELLASMMMARHEFRKAHDVAMMVDSLDPGSPAHLALLGEIELELGDYRSAANHFEAVHYDGRNFTTGARIARWYELTGRNGMARALLKRAIVLVDKRDDMPREQIAWFHYRLGDLELRAGNIAAAESAFVRGLSINPGDFRVLGGLARSSLARGDWARAVTYGESATQSQLDPATLGIISVAYSRLGDSSQAASYAHAMSVSALRQPGAIHRAWGLFLLDNGTAADRADVLRRARRELEDRQDVYGHDLMAWALYRNGRLREAREEMRLALSQNTEDVMLAEHARIISSSTPTR